MRRWIGGLLIAGVGAFLLWWLLQPSPPAAGAVAGARAPGAASSDPAPLDRGALNRILTAPLQPRPGRLSIRGVVQGPSGPVPGAVVTATTGAGDDVLSRLTCTCGNHCGNKLLECGCPEAADEIMALVTERRGEAPPVARTTSGADGSFAIADLDQGRYALWADAPGVGTGVAESVSAGDEHAEVEVEGGVALKGVVKGEDGAGLAGAIVTAVYARHSRFFDALTGADGRFALGPLPPGRYAVVAYREGLLPAHDHGGDGGRELALVLHPPRTLPVSVLDGSGAPVAGAQVRLSGEHRAATEPTGLDGKAAFARLRPGDYQLTAEIGGDVASGSATVAPGKAPAEVVLRLGAGASLSGSVAFADGVPVAGARVTLRARGGTQEATSGEDGRFHVEPLPAGEYRVSASADGAVVGEEQRVTLSAGREEVVALTLQRGVAISGEVVDADGNPVAGVSIAAEGQRSERDGWTGRLGSAHSGEDGRFTVKGLVPAAFAVSARDGARGATAHARAPATGVRLQFGAGAGLDGAVLGAGDAPVPEASVSVNGSNHQSVDLTTDRGGAFSLSGLAAGTYDVTATSPEGSSASSVARASVAVKEGERTRVELRLDAGPAIAGRVVDGAGKPLAGAVVAAVAIPDSSADTEDFEVLAELSRATATTGDDGRFRFAGLQPRPHMIHARVPGYTQKAAMLSATPGGPDVTVAMKPTPRFRGRALDEAGQPITRVSVDGQWADAPGGRFDVATRELSFLGEMADRTAVVAADGYAAKRVPAQPGANPAVVDLGDVVLARGRAVEGLVVDPQGAPAPSAEVYAPERSLYATSDGSGHFTLPAAPPDAFDLMASASGFAPAHATVAPGQSTVTLQLARGGAITGRVRRADGSPGGGAVVLAGSQHAQARADGSYALAGVPPGKVSVTVELKGASFPPVVANVTEGETTRLDLAEATGGATVAVSLTDAAGQPPPVTVLLLARGEVPLPSSASDLETLGGVTPGPRNTFAHVPAGTYTLFALRFRGASMGVARQVISVPADGRLEVTFALPAELKIIPM